MNTPAAATISITVSTGAGDRQHRRPSAGASSFFADGASDWRPQAAGGAAAASEHFTGVLFWGWW